MHDLCSFKRLCEDAFLKMRDRGTLFLNLFTMMLSCGIPELRTRADIMYIRLVWAQLFCNAKLVAMQFIHKSYSVCISVFLKYPRTPVSKCPKYLYRI